MKTGFWGYDIETIINCFTISFRNPYTKEKRQFVISELRDDSIELETFVKFEVDGLIGFNCIFFDSPVLAWVLEHISHGVKAPDLAYGAYCQAQEIIESEIRGAKKPLGSVPGVKELDLFLLHHFDNSAKATSLKWLQCHFRVPLVQEMPHKHNKFVTTLKEIDAILEYNLNDVDSTLILFNHPKTQELIQIRKWACDKYNDPTMLNISNSSMGEKIFYKELSKHGEVEKPYPTRAFRLDEIIFPWIKFKTPIFNKVLDAMKIYTVTPGSSKPFGYSVTFNGMDYDFGTGGLHAARGGQTFQAIHSIDVQSYYPRLAIENNLIPRHLSAEFILTYDSIFRERVKTAKGSAMNLAFKETLNSAFGKSNSEYSFLFDPMFMHAITINGQLLLAMLCEEIEAGGNIVVMANTDGIEVIVNNKMNFDATMEWWQDLTRLKLEAAYYSKIMIRDVNSYLAIKEDNTLKLKGAYEFDKEFHKDPSMRIVPLLVAKAFQEGWPQAKMKTAIFESKDLHDFFMYARAKTGIFTCVSMDGKATVEIPKTIRYLITKTGWVLNRTTDAKSDKIHKGVYVTILNDLRIEDPSEEQILESINRNWYWEEVKKLYITPAPTTLFSL